MGIDRAGENGKPGFPEETGSELLPQAASNLPTSGAASSNATPTGPLNDMPQRMAQSGQPTERRVPRRFALNCLRGAVATAIGVNAFTGSDAAKPPAIRSKKSLALSRPSQPESIRDLAPLGPRDIGPGERRLFAQLARRAHAIDQSGYYAPERSTRVNGPADALQVVRCYQEGIDRQSRKYGVPQALLEGLLASEVNFDTRWRVHDSFVQGWFHLGRGVGAFRLHSETLFASCEYLRDVVVPTDLLDVGQTSRIDFSVLTDYVTNPQTNGYNLDDFATYHETEAAAIISLSLAHQMWSAGWKQPDTKTPFRFSEFMSSSLSPTRMSTLFEAYRAGSNALDGFNGYDDRLGVHRIMYGADDFAKAVHDPRAVMGYNAWQAEPYFEYFAARK
ncbi:hypothetical protein LJR230_002126 [Trinickia sp. LjRoot230]|uniref:hypothetical protein n=1 Tax=Trinickia sp. LjRoot230 TaxID=3342288 RepID=UPI003ECF08F3